MLTEYVSSTKPLPMTDTRVDASFETTAGSIAVTEKVVATGVGEAVAVGMAVGVAAGVGANAGVFDAVGMLMVGDSPGVAVATAVGVAPVFGVGEGVAAGVPIPTTIGTGELGATVAEVVVSRAEGATSVGAAAVGTELAATVGAAGAAIVATWLIATVVAVATAGTDTGVRLGRGVLATETDSVWGVAVIVEGEDAAETVDKPIPSNTEPPVRAPATRQTNLTPNARSLCGERCHSRAAGWAAS
jgi:hypothetical protein